MNIVRFLIPKSSVEYVKLGSTVRQAFEKMRYHHYVAIPVLDEEGKYIATLRSEDVFRYVISNGGLDLKLAEQDELRGIIDPEYSRPLSHDAPIEDMIEYVKEHNFVPVVDDRGCFIGIILRRDVLSFLFNHYKQTENK